MKAAICNRYGPPEVIEVVDVDTPLPAAGQVLVRVRSTAVNSGDVRMRKPDPFAVRFAFGLLRPKFPILGTSLAGEVEEVGDDVTLFQPGDKVFGSAGITFGAHAEYICLPETGAIAHKPESLSNEEAAVIPFGGTTALFFLRKGNIREGHRLLVYGASGAIGTSAVQLARHFGAHVTGVCSTANLELVANLGAGEVVDYTKEDFAARGSTYDLILDTVGKSPFAACIKALAPDGAYLRVVHMDAAPILRGLWTNMTSKKRVIGGVITESAADIEFLANRAAAGELKPVIDRTYAIAQIAAAHRYVEQGHKKGNVVITVA